MKASPLCFAIQEHFEGFELNAYQDSAKVWTIAKGITIYPDGSRVKEGDKCTISQARDWYLAALADAEHKLKGWIKPEIMAVLSQNQYDALVDFTYNVGYGKGLIDAVNNNPKDPKIWGYFLLYDKVDASHDGKDNDGDGIIDEPGEKKVELGLVRRRQCEGNLYFLGTIDYYENLQL